MLHAYWVDTVRTVVTVRMGVRSCNVRKYLFMRVTRASRLGARAAALTIVTANVGEFSRVPGLAVDDLLGA